MNQDRNIGSAFLDVAQRCPELLAIVTDEFVLNYAQFAAVVVSHARQMKKLGVGRTSTVMIETSNVAIAASTVLATALLGARWISHRSYSSLAEEVTPTHFFRSPEAPSNTASIVIDDSWLHPNVDTTDLSAFDGPLSSEDPWLFVSTSGTTGRPKLMSIGQRIVYDRSMVVADDFRMRETVFCCLFGCVAFPFVTRAVATFLNGCTLVYSSDFKQWQRAGVNLVMGSPVQVEEMLGQVSIQPRLREIHLAGARLPDDLAVRLFNCFERVVDLYASSETNRSFKNHKSIGPSGELVTVGQRLDSDVEVVLDDGTPCRVDQEGVVRVRNSYLAPGYINNKPAELLSFRDGWFYPGDRGKWTRTGALMITGRTDDVINLGGVKVNAVIVDEIMHSASGVQDALCFRSPLRNEQNMLLCAVVPKPGSDLGQIRDELASLFEKSLKKSERPQRIITVEQIPRAHDGGAQRWLCAKQYEERHTAS